MPVIGKGVREASQGRFEDFLVHWIIESLISVSPAEFEDALRLFCFDIFLVEEQSISIAKKSAALTGPVMTLLDLVVHVPVNCGSVFADTKDIRTAPVPSDDGSDRIMECIRSDVSSVCRLERQLTSFNKRISVPMVVCPTTRVRKLKQVVKGELKLLVCLEIDLILLHHLYFSLYFRCGFQHSHDI